MFKLPQSVSEILEKLKKSGYEAYVVGGAVRDFVMGKQPQDFDITTSARPEDVCRVFADKRLIEIGKKHGTVAVVTDHGTVEITTYRTDVSYDDHRHPCEVDFCTSLHEDIVRRDFTVNALAFDGVGITDLCGGVADISCKRIRAVGDPDKRFEEDALRIMRALRFASVLCFDIEEETRRAIFENKELLRVISKERVTAELMKLLCGDNAEKVICEYSEVLDIILPGIEKMHGFEHFSKYHIYDVLVHTAKTVALCPKVPIIRLAALLHDVGKPVCFTQEECGIRHFKGHPKVSLEITKKALSNLALSNEEKALLLFLVEFHDERIDSTKEQVKRWMSAYSKEYFDALLHIKKADAETHSNYNQLQRISARELREIFDGIVQNNEPYKISMLEIDGNDLIAAGIDKGSQIGDILNELLELVITEKLKNEKDELLSYAMQNV